MSILTRGGAGVSVGAAALASLQINDAQTNKASKFHRVLGIMGAFPQSTEIKDPYTSEKHVNSVALLFSNATKNSPQIFRYANKFIPQTSEQAKDLVLQGNYVRCPSKFQLLCQSGDVIIAGTTEPKICNQFQHDALRDLAVRAGNNPLNPKHPSANISVFERSAHGLIHAGDLTGMSATAQAQLAVNNFKACPNYCGKKVIIAGDTSRSACYDLFQTTNLSLVTSA